jgi:hypothetical protein
LRGLNQAMTVHELVERLGIDPEEVGFIIANGVQEGAR